VICVVCVLASSAATADEPRETQRFDLSRSSPGYVDRPGPDRPAPTPAYANRFSSRVHFQMETMSVITQTAEPGLDPQDHLLYEELSLAVERDVRRETRRAVRDFLLEVTAVDQLVDNFLSRSIGSIGGGGKATSGGRRALDFSVGVSHLLPEIEMQYDLGGRKSFKLGVDGRGSVGMRYRDPRLGGNEVGFGFDGDDTFYVNWGIKGF
jgi:hypothetical protein